MKKELQNYQINSKSPNSFLVRSYGRVKSRKLSDHKTLLLKKLLAFYKISEDLSKEELDSFNKKSFEIGFGFGDFLFKKAANNPNQLFFGCEPHLNGASNLLVKLEERPLNNIKISLEDARILLEKFPDNFFDEFYILFPDPWPKSKHFKRRIINQDLFDNLLARKLKRDAKLIIATDHASYKTWILSVILKSEKFKWNASSKRDWQTFPDDWIETKYQKKAANEGRVSVIFNLIKK